MIKKAKYIFPILVLGIMLSNTAFADTITTNGGSDVPITRSVCLANAKTIYKNAVKSAVDTAKAANLTAKNTRTAAIKEALVTSADGLAAIKAAKTTYQAALKSAKAITDKTARDAAIKTATDNYKAALKNARLTITTGSTAVKTARAAYKTAVITNAKTKAASIKAALSDYTTALKACLKK